MEYRKDAVEQAFVHDIEKHIDMLSCINIERKGGLRKKRVCLAEDDVRKGLTTIKV